MNITTDFFDWSSFIETELCLFPSVFKIRLAYKTYMKTIARLLGGGYDSEQKMMHIYDFEADLAGVGYSRSCNWNTSMA